ncbi:MAG: ADP compounds hydrolase NudE [Pseudomonadales bacterium]
MKKVLPEVTASQWLTHSRLFHVEELQLKFSNGVERTYERLNPGYHRAVMVLPMLDDDTLLLVREYGAGLGDYYLSFPKGAIDSGETNMQAANRELMEEAGHGAQVLTYLTRLSLSPSYMGNQMDIILGQDLYPQRLAGDEPEQLEVVALSFAQVEQMISKGEIMEAYAVAAFYMLKARRDTAHDAG